MIEVCKGTNLSVFLQRIKQKEEMENKKPIVLNNLEEWDFTDYIDSLIQKEEAVDLEFKIAKDGLPNSLWDTYSSFANTDGGVIILGVKEYKQQFIIEGLTKEQISQYKKDFWNQINNPDCVNENLLSDNDLYEGCYKGKNLLLIYVPRATRIQRPIYRTRNPFGGHTFKRNHEGDYKCTDAEVKRLIADSDENHPRDSRILCNYSIEDIDKETLTQYRQLFANLKPSHPWLSLNDLEFLTKLEAYRKDRHTKEEGFTLGIPLPPVVKPAFVDTCRTGMTCIEDYSDSTLRGMTPFYKALDRVSSDDSDDKQVRIAVFGDSFIEADIFTADLREMLQKQFGGCGVGFVTITSMTSGYRPTVRHTFGGWSSHAVTDSVYFDKKKQGISGHYFVPRNGAYVELRGQNKYASLLDTCQRASIFFHSRDSVLLSVRVNKGENKNYSLGPSDGLQQIQVDGRIGSIRWTVDRADSTLFYGLAMDGKKGIVLDNFSLRGSSGLSLRGIPPQMLKQFNRQRPYDLIILEYGLNVATERGRNYDNYQKGLLTAIEHLKECFPQAGILLLSVGDRDSKNENGELRTMPGVKNLIRYQQNIAAESGIAFWNMFEAMGGEGSMAKLVHATS